MEIYKQLGALALASRLKALSETLSKDVASVYEHMDIAFEPRWFTLFWALKHTTSLTITELAKELRQTHSAVVQLTNLLEKKGLLISTKDKNDERRRQVSLSDKGVRLFEKVEPVLHAIEKANKDLIAQNVPELLSSITHLEQALDEQSMQERILKNLELMHQDISLKTFSSHYNELFNKIHKDHILNYIAPTTVFNESTNNEKETTTFFSTQKDNVIGRTIINVVNKETYQLSELAIFKNSNNNHILAESLFEAVKTHALSKEVRSLETFIDPLIPDILNFFISRGFMATGVSETINSPGLKSYLKMHLNLERP